MYLSNMEQIFVNKINQLGYNNLVCDIFPQWEDVKDEILVPDRKSGTGNGTIHVFLGVSDAELKKEFSSYYHAVDMGEDPSIGAIPITHFFLESNILSMLGYVCKYYYSKGQDTNNQVKNILSILSSFSNGTGLLETTSFFKLSTGSSRLRPYFKQFDSNGVFTKLIRQLLLPNSGYKISLFKNEKGEYAAFWLIGFEWQTDFEASLNKSLFDDKKNTEIGENTLQQIYYGAPGTGKSYEINRITKNKEVIRTTFHPDSDYSTFVGAYKPTSIEVPVRDVTGKVIIENGQKVTENRIIYEFVEQAFLQAYIKAWNAYIELTEGEKVKEQYLVIEEINRGNCAQIFGDLFQLLDRNEYGFSDYPIQADKDMKKQLKKVFSGKTIANPEYINNIYDKDIVSQVLSGDILLLPDNLYIYATMNTSDQSLFPIDSAFKRRWDWKYIPISEGKTETGEPIGYKIKVNDKNYDWWTFLENINKEIDDQTKSEDKKLGYFFCKANGGIISAETFVSKVVFYLWNDVFKDQDAGSIFSDGDRVQTFSMFYDTNSLGRTIINEDEVEIFLKNLKVPYIVEEILGSEDELEMKNGSKHKSLKSVSFPDGTIFSTESLTHFNIYLESLKKIGMDVVYPKVSEMGYNRVGHPLVTLEKYPEVEAKKYTYVQIEKYYVVKGAIDDTLIAILDGLNKSLGLGLIINYD